MGHGTQSLQHVETTLSSFHIVQAEQQNWKTLRGSLVTRRWVHVGPHVARRSLLCMLPCQTGSRAKNLHTTSSNRHHERSMGFRWFEVHHWLYPSNMVIFSCHHSICQRVMILTTWITWKQKVTWHEVAHCKWSVPPNPGSGSHPHALEIPGIPHSSISQPLPKGIG